MKIVVFGSSGYIGASVYQSLQTIWDAEVVGTYRNEPAFPELIQLDINEAEDFSTVYKQEKPDVVIWLLMGGVKEYKLSERGLMHLITHLTPNTKLIYLSSDFVFAEGNGPYTEEDMRSIMPEGKTFSGYANAKAKAEKLIEQELTNYVILRAGPVYGENAVGKRDAHTERLINRMEKSEVARYREDVVRTFIHLDDLAEVIKESVTSKLTGTYHVGREKGQSFYEFLKEQAEEEGYDPELVQPDSEKETMQSQPRNLVLNTERVRRFSRVPIR